MKKAVTKWIQYRIYGVTAFLVDAKILSLPTVRRMWYDTQKGKFYIAKARCTWNNFSELVLLQVHMGFAVR